MLKRLKLLLMLLCLLTKLESMLCLLNGHEACLTCSKMPLELRSGVFVCVSCVFAGLS